MQRYIILLVAIVFFVGCSNRDDSLNNSVNSNKFSISQDFLKDSYGVENQALDQISDVLKADNLLVEDEGSNVQEKLKPNPEAKKQIFLAIKNNDYDALEALMDKYSITGLRDKSSYTPLIRAAKVASETGKLYTLRLLSVSPEVDVNGKDGWGYTALTWTCIENHYSATNILLSTPFKIDPNPRDLNGRTPLIWSVLTQNIPRMQDKYGAFNALLITRGIDVDAFDDINGWTALFYAVRLNGIESSGLIDDRLNNERLDIVTKLIARGANITHRDSFGLTALDWAKALNRSQEMLDLLDYNNPMRITADSQQ